MFLEILTFALLSLVLALKYGTVTRIVRLNQRLREAENRCKKYIEGLKVVQGERRLSEREESHLVRRQLALERQFTQATKDMHAIQEANTEVVQELIAKKVSLREIEGVADEE